MGAPPATVEPPAAMEGPSDARAASPDASDATHEEPAISPRVVMRTKKLRNRTEIEGALETLKIELNRNEMRLMFRDVDDEFLVREKAAQEADRLKKRAEREKKRQQKAAIMHSRQSPRSPKAVSPKDKKELKSVAHTVRTIKRVLEKMRPEMTMDPCLHADSKYHKSFLNAPKARDHIASSEEQRQQYLIKKSIGRVKARRRLHDQRLAESVQVTIALSGREPGSPRASDRYATDHDELALIFKEIDEDNSGYLDKDEVGLLFQRLGKHLTKTEIEEAMRQIQIILEAAYCAWSVCLMHCAVPGGGVGRARYFVLARYRAELSGAHL